MLRHWLWGPLSPLGLGIAALTAILDQAHKIWMLRVYDIGAKGSVALAPFFDLVLVWNHGISYGLLPQESTLGRWGLILFAIAASLALAVWLDISPEPTIPNLNSFMALQFSCFQHFTSRRALFPRISASTSFLSPRLRRNSSMTVS